MKVASVSPGRPTPVAQPVAPAPPPKEADAESDGFEGLRRLSRRRRCRIRSCRCRDHDARGTPGRVREPEHLGVWDLRPASQLPAPAGVDEASRHGVDRVGGPWVVHGGSVPRTTSRPRSARTSSPCRMPTLTPPRPTRTRLRPRRMIPMSEQILDRTATTTGPSLPPVTESSHQGAPRRSRTFVVVAVAIVAGLVVGGMALFLMESGSQDELLGPVPSAAAAGGTASGAEDAQAAEAAAAEQRPPRRQGCESRAAIPSHRW